MTAAGTLLLPRTSDHGARAAINRIDPRKAASQALSAYLLSQTFLKWGGETGEDVPFQLCEVTEEWPEPSKVQTYPGASITETTPTTMGAHSFTPTPLESTRDVYAPNTMLWKLAEVSKLFQVDFWTITAPDREAIAASLPGMFAPGESASRVVLSASEQYYCLPVRCSLESYQRSDTPNSVYASERRLLSLIRCDIDVVELRCAVPFVPRVQLDVQVGALPSVEDESSPLPVGCNVGG